MSHLQIIGLKTDLRDPRARQAELRAHRQPGRNAGVLHLPAHAGRYGSQAGRTEPQAAPDQRADRHVGPPPKTRNQSLRMQTNRSSTPCRMVEHCCRSYSVWPAGATNCARRASYCPSFLSNAAQAAAAVPLRGPRSRYCVVRGAGQSQPVRFRHHSGPGCRGHSNRRNGPWVLSTPRPRPCSSRSRPRGLTPSPACSRPRRVPAAVAAGVRQHVAESAIASLTSRASQAIPDESAAVEQQIKAIAAEQWSARLLDLRCRAAR